MTLQPKILFDTTPLGSSLDLLSHFTDADLASACRSTVPLVALIKDDRETFAEILTQCGTVGDVEVAFERTVSSRAAGERPSFTDAMVTAATNVLAIEAKWTEPRYATVLTRLKPDPTERDHASATTRNREYVDGWLEHIRPFASRPIQLDEFGDCVYQMMHRAASACGAAGNGRRPSLAYLHFTCDELPTCGSPTTRTPPYFDDLTALHRLLGSPDGFPFFVVEVPIRLTSAFRTIERLKKGEAATGRAVKEALRASVLFEFGEPSIRRVTSS